MMKGEEEKGRGRRREKRRETEKGIIRYRNG